MLSRVHHPWYNMSMPASPVRKPWPLDPRFLIGSDGSITGPSGQPLALFVAKRTGYLRFTRYAAGRWSQHFVHVAVCETFHGPRPPGHDAAHGNGDQLDCSAENVTWKTPAENEADKIVHGTRAQCETHGMHKLTADQVREIRASREPARVFAVRFDVSVTAVKYARTGRTWGALA